MIVARGESECICENHEDLGKNAPGREVKPFGQRRNLAHVEFALASQDLRNDALAANLGKVSLGKAVLFHQELQHFNSGSLRDRVVLLVVRLDQDAERVDESIARAFRVIADLVNQRVEFFDRRVVFAGVADCEQRRIGLRLLETTDDGSIVHFLHSALMRGHPRAEGIEHSEMRRGLEIATKFMRLSKAPSSVILTRKLQC